MPVSVTPVYSIIPPVTDIPLHYDDMEMDEKKTTTSSSSSSFSINNHDTTTEATEEKKRIDLPNSTIINIGYDEEEEALRSSSHGIHKGKGMVDIELYSADTGGHASACCARCCSSVCCCCEDSFLQPGSALSYLKSSNPGSARRKEILEYITANMEEILNTPYFEHDIDKHDLLALVKSSRLQCNEISLFKGVLRWSVQQCKLQGKEPTTANVRMIISPYLQFIRFPTMSLDDIANVVKETNVLTIDEMLNIYMSIATKNWSSPDIMFDEKEIKEEKRYSNSSQLLPFFSDYKDEYSGSSGTESDSSEPSSEEEKKEKKGKLRLAPSLPQPFRPLACPVTSRFRSIPRDGHYYKFEGLRNKFNDLRERTKNFLCCFYCFCVFCQPFLSMTLLPAAVICLLVYGNSPNDYSPVNMLIPFILYVGYMLLAQATICFCNSCRCCCDDCEFNAMEENFDQYCIHPYVYDSDCHDPCSGFFEEKSGCLCMSWIFSILLFGVGSLLIVLKVTNAATYPVTVAFIPFYILLVFLQFAFFNMMAEDSCGCSDDCCGVSTVSAFFFNGPLLVTLILVNVRLESGLEGYYVMLPFSIVVGLCFIIAVVACICCRQDGDCCEHTLRCFGATAFLTVFGVWFSMLALWMYSRDNFGNVSTYSPSLYSANIPLYIILAAMFLLFLYLTFVVGDKYSEFQAGFASSANYATYPSHLMQHLHPSVRPFGEELDDDDDDILL